ncbi:hypothetical protein ECDEC1A_5057 [Escherichia coli DEC1A]|nr:hypothetical protein ECDEC1A_5057 [Escherichia coli DEC1A]EHU10161.1 hypothetical protein ECDEC1C_2371 [Escherichia coli DEC1C]EHU35819.1 hypothetical protein ECDEC2C_5100 [Escherichia coli DEC2C]EMZ78164.1 hypothetical protein EC2722950_3278 [Escherichia coli 2722950]
MICINIKEYIVNTSPELIYYRQGMKMPDFMLIYGNKDK